ncbi:MAG: GDP-mannose 4,6-dehydratase [Pseudomonadota bacterium]
MASYLLIGGSGAFAIHTTKFLLEQEETTRVIGVGRNPWPSPLYTLRVGENDPRYAYHQIHLVFEQDRLMELIDAEKPDYIINFAALAYATSWEKSHRYYETNVVAVAKLCEQLAKRDFLKRFLQIGTSELYGSNDEPVSETAPLNPTSPYAVSKMAADLHLDTMWAVQKFPMNIIRPSNAYGAGQYGYRILPKAVLCGLTNQRFPLEGGGMVRKSFLNARDLARAIYLICQNAPLGETYNAGTLEPVSMRRLVEIVAEILGLDFDEFAEMRPGRVGEDAQYWLDSSKIKRDLGWEPEIDLHTGIGEMVDWGRQYLELLSDAPQQFVLRA